LKAVDKDSDQNIARLRLPVRLCGAIAKRLEPLETAAIGQSSLLFALTRQQRPSGLNLAGQRSILK
jgi:hypothetical protein